jgi:hypothetical protein
VKAVLRAITKEPWMRDRSVVRLSGHAIDEKVLFRIARHVSERHDHDGEMRRTGFFGRCGGRGLGLGRDADF